MSKDGKVLHTLRVRDIAMHVAFPAWHLVAAKVVLNREHHSPFSLLGHINEKQEELPFSKASNGQDIHFNIVAKKDLKTFEEL